MAAPTIGTSVELTVEFPAIQHIIACDIHRVWMQNTDTRTIHTLKTPSSPSILKSDPPSYTPPWSTPLPLKRNIPSTIVAAATATFDTTHCLVVYDTDENFTAIHVDACTGAVTEVASLSLPCDALTTASIRHSATLTVISATISIITPTIIVAVFDDNATFYRIDLSTKHATVLPIRIGSRLSNPFPFAISDTDTRPACVAFAVGRTKDDRDRAIRSAYSNSKHNLDQPPGPCHDISIYDPIADAFVLLPTIISVYPVGSHIGDIVRLHATVVPSLGIFFTFTHLTAIAFAVVAPGNPITITVAGFEPNGPGYLFGATSFTKDNRVHLSLVNSFASAWELDILRHMETLANKDMLRMEPRNLYKRHGMVTMYNSLASSVLIYTPDMIIVFQSPERICFTSRDYDGDPPAAS